MIDEKRLVKEMKNWIKTDRFGDFSAGYILSDVIEEINKMPKVGEWIPCSERLPEPYTKVLVTFKDITGFAVETNVYSSRTGWLFYKGRVIAWQPLPEPYREEKK